MDFVGEKIDGDVQGVGGDVLEELSCEKVEEVIFKGGSFKYVLFSPQQLGKWSILTSIFFKWVGSTTN